MIASLIWVSGPYLTWGNYAPLIQPEKRLYLISFVYLAWFLKFLIVDLEAPNPFQYKDAFTSKKLNDLQQRFNGAIQFLKKTQTTKQGETVRLNQLPWNILIGPPNSGKTTLLAKSGVHFILQRQFSNKNLDQIEASENYDWWVTRDASIVDVPSRYFTANVASGQKVNINPIMWRFFLRLIKKQRGKHGISGIVLALPLPEIMKQADPKRYHQQLRDLFNRINDIQKIFPQPIPCQLVITKCDLLPGFTEFFAESSNEEIMQAWGINLVDGHAEEKTHDAFIQRFNALIKKINQQLLWRLHQERNPMARPYIKDFPLQIERLKEYTFDFIKKLTAANLSIQLQGVYLTSALQTKPEPENNIIDAPVNDSTRAVQLFKEPTPSSRAYFIKQFITHGLAHNSNSVSAPVFDDNRWKTRVAYTVSVTIISVTAIMMIRDFEHGIKQTYAIQSNLSDYQLAIQQIHDPDEHLIKTLDLMDALKQSTTSLTSKLTHVISFYTHKSQTQSIITYHQALRNIFLPEIRNYFTEYLKNPLNHNTENVYGVFKAYLMLGDAAHYQPDFVATMFKSTLSKHIDAIQTENLMNHLQLALNNDWTPVALDNNLVEQMRRYFNGMPSFQLGYIILKNMDTNNTTSDVNLGINADGSIFTTQQLTHEIPSMYTAKSFASILTDQATQAAQEAVTGNWVLGDNAAINKNPVVINNLIDQLRVSYVNNYIGVWEGLLSNIRVSNAANLAELDNMISNLISSNSPLLQLLQTLHDNTYFEPIVSSSPKLQTMGSLLDKTNQQANVLYQIFSSLQSLHLYVQTILSAQDEKKAAFNALTVLMQTRNTPDAITQLRLIADRSPDPVKNWLNKIADDAWRIIMTDAGNYLDTSWQEKVVHLYQTEIANRYPFNAEATQEVALQKFSDFFGNPGVVMDFYNNYLQAFVDTSTPEWRWKTLNDTKLPFADDTLRQIQNAMRIHHTFFPNNDKKLYVQFTLQPFKFGKNVREVQLSINDKKFVDMRNDTNTQHAFAWPSEEEQGNTSIQLTMANQETINRDYPGEWGWFKLVSQSFESVVSKKELMINLSMNEHPVQYLLFTDGRFNPFLSLNLRHFHLPNQLTEDKA